MGVIPLGQAGNGQTTYIAVANLRLEWIEFQLQFVGRRGTWSAHIPSLFPGRAPEGYPECNSNVDGTRSGKL